MKKTIASMLICFSLGSLNCQAEIAATDCPKDLLIKSGLTATDFENVGWFYKMESEQHGNNKYDLEYKFSLAAAELGSKEAMLWLGEMYQGGHVQGVEDKEAVQMAFKWWDKAFKAGQPRGYTDMALMYLHKEVPGGGKNFTSIPINSTKALALLNKATDAGDMKAPRILGLLYLEGGEAVKKDEVRALSYFKKAMNLGDSTGTVYYADALLSGKLVSQDIPNAMALYQKIVDSNVHDAGLCAFKLGKIYEDGKYVGKDLDKAVSYYKIATEHKNTDAQSALNRLKS